MNSPERRRRARRRREARERVRRERALALGVLDFEANFSPEALMESALACRRGVGWKGSVQRWMLSGWLNCARLSEAILDGSYRKRPRRRFRISERGKSRLISPVAFGDRVVERALCERVLLPLLEPEMTHDNAASRVGKGTDFARARLAAALARAARGAARAGGASAADGPCVLLYDFSDFFASVPTARAMAAIEGRLLCLARTPAEREAAVRTAALVRTFVCEGAGLGLGNQTSQVVAVWWASPIDHWLCEVARVPNGRYMDDGWAVFPDRATALAALGHVRGMAASLGLALNEGKVRVALVGESVCYLKAVFRARPTGGCGRRVAARSLRAWRRHAAAVARLRSHGAVDDDGLGRALASRRSLARRCDARTRRRLLRRLDAIAARLMCP